MGREMLNLWDISRLAEANGYAGLDAMAAGDALADAVAHAADGSATEALTARLKTLHTKPAAVADVIGKCPQTVRKWISEADARLVETAGRNCRAAALCVALAALGGRGRFRPYAHGRGAGAGRADAAGPRKGKDGGGTAGRSDRRYRGALRKDAARQPRGACGGRGGARQQVAEPFRGCG